MLWFHYTMRQSEPLYPNETPIETEVTYTLEFGGTFYIIEHVPARVCPETGEQCFSPETVYSIRQRNK